MARDIANPAGRAVAAPAAGRFPSPGLLVPAVRGWIADGLAVEAERRALFPWLAVAFGAGILVFFTATDGQPALWAPLAAAGACAAILPALGARPVGLAVTLALIAALLGFAAGAVRVARVAAPVLTRTVIAPLSGTIESLEEREEGARLVVRVASLGTMPAAERPVRVRVSFKRAPSLRPGDFVTATARLLPPPEAARPGGYDFARDAYFHGIGAVGSLLGTIAVGPPPEPVPWALRLSAAVDEARNALTRRITDANGGQAGAVAAALVTGKRGLIAPDTNDVLRAAGIYHVVSISGLHMVLAAGVVFWLVRAGLALVPFLALVWPIKKIAAACAMVGVTAYCVFSGWDIAAERSLVMTLIMLGAILVDRPALSMRNLALAAMLALAHEPEGVLGPSFQMSFGAVAGLIACARLIDARLLRRDGAGPVGRLLALALATVIGTLGTTLVAQIATAPFATYHFQTVQPFGLIGNALTLPLVSLAVMPSAVLGILAYPFALDRPVWWLMGLAVRGMLTISAWIAGLGQANVVVPAFGTAALGCLAAGLLAATLPASHLRRLALAPAALGLCLAAAPTRYDIYVDRQGGGAAVRGPDGTLTALGRPSAFVLEQWLRADGDARRAAQAAAGPACDRIGCTFRLRDGRAVAILKDRRGFAEDCARAAVLITALAAPPGCAADLVIDRAYLARHGAVAIRVEPDGYALAHTREPGRTLPWRPPEARAAARVAPPARPAAPVDAERALPFQGIAPLARPPDPPDEPAEDAPPAEAQGESLQ